MLDDRAFYNCSYLKSVRFPSSSSLSRLGRYAFSGSGLVTFELPHLITYINTGVFNDCGQLQTISFASNSTLKNIGQYAFRNSGLRRIAIPSSVSRIYSYAFLSCRSLDYVQFYCGQLSRIYKSAFASTGLRSITIPRWMSVDSGNPSLGWLSCVSCSDVDANSGNLIVPAAVKNIGVRQFSSCTALTGNVTFENESQCESIDTEAFAGADIVSITIPSSVVKLDDRALYHCIHLIDISFLHNSELSIIGASALEGTRIRSIYIPSKVVSIGNNAFLGCIDLTFASFLDIYKSKLNSIGQKAFYNVSLTSMQFPLSLKLIYDRSFMYCSSLQSVKFEKYGMLTSIGVSAFESADLQNISFPVQVLSINSHAFANNHLLDKITFDCASHTNISGDAFLGTNVDSLALPVTATCSACNIQVMTLDCVYCSDVDRTSGNLVVPASVKNIGWKQFEFCSALTGSVTFAPDSQCESIDQQAFIGSKLEFSH